MCRQTWKFCSADDKYSMNLGNEITFLTLTVGMTSPLVDTVCGQVGLICLTPCCWSPCSNFCGDAPVSLDILHTFPSSVFCTSNIAIQEDTCMTVEEIEWLIQFAFLLCLSLAIKMCDAHAINAWVLGHLVSCEAQSMAWMLPYTIFADSSAKQTWFLSQFGYVSLCHFLAGSATFPSKPITDTGPHHWIANNYWQLLNNYWQAAGSYWLTTVYSWQITSIDNNWPWSLRLLAVYWQDWSVYYRLLPVMQDY